jgi:polar amino acid transport system substrate-binding protein
MTETQPSPDPRVADLVAAGRVRVALFPPQYTKDPATGALRGPWLEVIRALCEHIGVPAEVTEVANPEAMVARLSSGAIDLASLGFDPERAGLVGGFSPAFMEVEYTAMAPPGSAIEGLGGIDLSGLRIAAVRGHASTLSLSRLLTRAAPVEVQTPDEAFACLRRGDADLWASIRPTLETYSEKWPGSRVLPGSYGANRPALVVPKGHEARLSFIVTFIEEARASGLLQRCIERAGEAGYRVAR